MLRLKDLPSTSRLWGSVLIVVGVCVSIGLTHEVYAGNIRGMLYWRTPQGSVPAAGIAVSVYRADLGRSGYSYTGDDGMYYLYGIPPGDYKLEIWLRGGGMLVYQYRVFNRAWTDFPPIAVNP
jgi:hypothetical protein